VRGNANHCEIRARTAYGPRLARLSLFLVAFPIPSPFSMSLLATARTANSLIRDYYGPLLTRLLIVRAARVDRSSVSLINRMSLTWKTAERALSDGPL